jgi:hypothetical protein
VVLGRVASPQPSDARSRTGLHPVAIARRPPAWAPVPHELDALAARLEDARADAPGEPCADPARTSGGYAAGRCSPVRGFVGVGGGT